MTTAERGLMPIVYALLFCAACQLVGSIQSCMLSEERAEHRRVKRQLAARAREGEWQMRELKVWLGKTSTVSAPDYYIPMQDGVGARPIPKEQP